MNHRTIVFLAAVSAAAVMFASGGAAQPSLQRPRTSQRAVVSQRVGVTDIEVTYHRPGVKGRQIWGGLVPYGTVWRTGANEVTTISFADPVTVEGSPLAAGTYGLFTIPGPSGWTVIFSSNTTTWGTVYDSTKDILRVSVAPRTSPHTEWMMFSFDGLADTGATLELSWERLTVPVRLGVNTTGLILDRARKEFSAGPDTGRWQMLRQAAGYAYSRDIALPDALVWIDRSLAVNRNFQSLCMKADILERLGDAKTAGSVIGEAVGRATVREVVSYALSLRRDDRPARAVDLLSRFAADRGSTWELSRALGESYDAAGDRATALSHLEGALSAAPDSEKAGIREIIEAVRARK